MTERQVSAHDLCASATLRSGTAGEAKLTLGAVLGFGIGERTEHVLVTLGGSL